MALLAVSFIAGILTVLAPCILPVLPVVIGASATGRSRATPYIVVGSLALSIILCTYLLKFSTALIMVPPSVWTFVSGAILIVFGAILVYPSLWEGIPSVAKMSARSNILVGRGARKKSFSGDVLIGAALGPVFSSCSPTYFVILASVLPASFALGTAYLFAYTTGLALILLLVALLGQRCADHLMSVADSRRWFKRGLGILFIVIGLLIVTGYEKRFEVWLLNSGFVDSIRWEQGILDRIHF